MSLASVWVHMLVAHLTSPPGRFAGRTIRIKVYSPLALLCPPTCSRRFFRMWPISCFSGVHYTKPHILIGFRSESGIRSEFLEFRDIHLHIFFYILRNSIGLGVNFIPGIPGISTDSFQAIPAGLTGIRIATTHHHHTVTCDCHLTTTTIHDTTAQPPTPSHSLPPLPPTLTSVNSDQHRSHALPRPPIKNKQKRAWLQTCHVTCVFRVLTTVDLC